MKKFDLKNKFLTCRKKISKYIFGYFVEVSRTHWTKPQVVLSYFVGLLILLTVLGSLLFGFEKLMILILKLIKVL